MYTLAIRDYLKCAHSLQGETFGLAQLLHVITYDVEVVFTTPELSPDGIVCDFATAQETLYNTLGSMNFKNLDELPFLQGKNTTTEFLCKYIHGQIAAAMADKFRGDVKVIMRESPVAWTTYEGKVGG
ncbi:MAG: 6-carboxytetrahydropterin synthase [Planctomycetota bacterium]